MGADKQKSRKQSREEAKAARAQSMSRRHALLTGLKWGGALALAGTAIGGVIHAVTQEPQRLGSEFPEVQEYYPEVAELISQENFEFQTDVFQTKVRVINFDQRKVDRNALKSAFNFFEQLGSVGLASEYTIHDTTLYLQFLHSDYKTRNIFIVPNNAPSPSWAGSNDESYHGNIGSTSNRLGDPILTLLRVPDQATPSEITPNTPFEEYQSFINMLFAVETCHFSIETQTNYRSDAILPPDISLRMQEIVCNSLGRAFAMKQSGYNYDTYFNYIVSSNFSLGDDYSYPWIKLPEKIYAQIPAVGSVLKK